jgi:hypothetical protein
MGGILLVLDGGMLLHASLAVKSTILLHALSFQQKKTLKEKFDGLPLVYSRYITSI